MNQKKKLKNENDMSERENVVNGDQGMGFENDARSEGGDDDE